MAPNSQVDKPICVSDSFHFSSFYWRESSASLAGLTGGQDDDDSVAGARGRSNTVGSEGDQGDTAVLKVLSLWACCSLLMSHVSLKNFFLLS